MQSWLERRFGLEGPGAIRREVAAGGTTYLAMSYIILVNPAVLSIAGMDSGSVLVATCLSASFASIWMGLHANYPIALAPGMGQNFFFALTVCGAVGVGGYGYTWQQGLAAVVAAGVIFIFMSVFGLRVMVMSWVPHHLRKSLGVGIGLLIAMVGLRWGGVLVQVPGTYVGLGALGSEAAMTTLLGFVVMGILTIRGFQTAIVVGVFASAAFALSIGQIEFAGVLGAPPSLAPTLLQLDIPGLVNQDNLFAVIFVILFVDLFDTVGTLLGVGERAGLLVDGRLPRGREAFLADAVGSVGGGLLGTSTVTSYVESAAGVAAGGKTGLTAVTTGILMALSVFIYPLLELVGGAWEQPDGTLLYPVLAPALILVGVFMLRTLGDVDWGRVEVAVPSFLTIFMMPLTTSITDGLSFGFISTSLFWLAAGRARELPLGCHLISAAFLLRYLWL